MREKTGDRVFFDTSASTKKNGQTNCSGKQNERTVENTIIKREYYDNNLYMWTRSIAKR